MKKLVVMIGAIYSLYALADDGVAKTITARSHSMQENRANSDKCAELGATDITDTMDLQLSANTSNVTVCYSPNPEHFNTVSALKNNLAQPHLETEAPNGEVPYGPYMVKGSASYSNASIGSELSIVVSVPEDKCRAEGVTKITAGSGSEYMIADCFYGINHGKHTSYTEAKLEGVFSTSTGMIVVQ